MKWKWVSRKHLDAAYIRYGIEATALSNRCIKAEAECAKLKHNCETLKSVVATLREEAAASKRVIKDLNAGLEAANLRKPAPKQPQLGNFLKTRDALEAGSRQNLPIKEIDLDEFQKQKEPANGR